MDTPLQLLAYRVFEDRSDPGPGIPRRRRRRRLAAVDAPPVMLRLLRAETRLYLRDVPSAVFALLVPAVVLVGAGLAIPGMRATLSGGAWDGLTMIQVYTPAVLTMALATPALSTLPVIVASYREHGVLRRLSTTPTPPSAVLGAQLVINLTAFVVAAVIALLTAATVFASPLPRQVPTAVLALALGALSLFGLGMLVAARARTGTSASGIGMLLYFPLLFLAGLWTPGPLMPESLRLVATYTPVGATSQALTTAWFDGGFPALQLAVLVGWTVLLYPLAAKTFRWS